MGRIIPYIVDKKNVPKQQPDTFLGKIPFFLDAMNFRHEELKPCSNMEGSPWTGTGMQCICYWNPYVLAG